MRKLFAAASCLVLIALVSPAAAGPGDIAYTPPHYPSMVTAGTASTIYGSVVAVTAFSIQDSTATLRFGLDGPTQTFAVSWTKQRLADDANEVWKVHITGTSPSGALDLQGLWNPTVGISMCTASIPAYCHAQAEGPIALTGYAGPYSLELAGIAFDTYSYTSGELVCLVCEARDILERIVR